MKQSTFRRYGILSQLGLLLIFFLINFVENYAWYSLFASFLYATNYTFMVAGTVVVNYFYILPYYLKGQRLLYFVLLFLAMTAFIIVYYIVDEALPFEYDSADVVQPFYPLGIFYDYLILILTTAYTSLYYFVEQWFKNISTEAQLRNEKLQAELNFLKSQINPHFLFNTLNNIYSYAQTGNKKTAPMLERLSSILRYMVYDCSEDRVPLDKELKAVEDLLEINQMKNSEQQNIKMSISGVKGYHLIAPLIIVNLVENACKHSDAVSNPMGFIHVDMSVDDIDNGVCIISNTIKRKVETAAGYSGVGSKNVKKRLDLQYGDSYELEEVNSNGIYTLQLHIPLERKK